MHDILHDVWINAAVEKIYDGISQPAGLDAWWTMTSRGQPTKGSTYELIFGPDYDWRGYVLRAEQNRSFELELRDAMPDWSGTRVSFDLEPLDSGVRLHFAHRGWKAMTEHFRISAFCWAMYLRILKRNIEHGEVVPYAIRLDV